MKAHKGKFYYWLVAISVLLLGYGQRNLPEPREVPQASKQATQSFHQNHSLKFVAEAASFEGIYVSGRNAAEDKSKPYAKYIVSHPGIDVHAQLASVYIHQFSIQAYFSTFLYLLYCRLTI